MYQVYVDRVWYVGIVKRRVDETDQKRADTNTCTADEETSRGPTAEQAARVLYIRLSASLYD